jgi:hypothetical protein
VIAPIANATGYPAFGSPSAQLRMQPDTLAFAIGLMVMRMLGMYARCYVSARFSFSISGYYVLPHWRKHNWCGDISRILLAATSAAIFPIVGISAIQWSESVLSHGRNQCSPMVGIRAFRCLVQHGKRTLYLTQFLKEGCVFYASMVE